MELKIFLRQTQMFANEGSDTIPQGKEVVFVGNNPASLRIEAGFVPKPTYEEYTNYVSNLETIKLTWTREINADGVRTPGSPTAKRTASSQLIFEDQAYLFIRDWLIENVSAPLNSIDVKIEDVGCGVYQEWVITSDQVSWCDDNSRICEFAVSLNQKDEALNCLQKTLISDNWQNWFDETPANGKKHPRFNYCNEVKPNGMMIVLWWLMSIVFSLMFMLAPIINSIIAIVKVILAIVNAIRSLFGGKKKWDVGFFNPLEMSEAFFMESSGCGRMHPAPLIRDYINNVCNKCGIAVDDITSPIFHSERIFIETSMDRWAKRGPQWHENPYYNACLLNAPVKRGIRIFDGMFNSDTSESDDKFYIPDNRPLDPADIFLDKICNLFNADWKIVRVGRVDTLYIWRKDLYHINNTVYNFSSGDDRNKIIQGICYNWLNKKNPAFMRGLYTSDPMDGAGNEALSYMNDIISLGSIVDNPGYQGELNKEVPDFGGTRFRLDGASDDYLANGMQVLLNGGILNPNLYAIVNTGIKRPIQKYADYALLLSEETCSLYKVIIWDPSSGYEFAKSVRSHSTYIPNVNGSELTLPEKHPMYNQAGKEWYELHWPDTKVKGSGLSFGSTPYGKYTVQELLGVDFYAKPAELVNYPMFFAPKFTGNIYDFFHWIDDPRINAKLNLQWSLKMDLCCEDLRHLGLVDSDASDVKLGGKVLLPLQYQAEGKITEITVSYDSEGDDEVGKYIELKGTV